MPPGAAPPVPAFAVSAPEPVKVAARPVSIPASQPVARLAKTDAQAQPPTSLPSGSLSLKLSSDALPVPTRVVGQSAPVAVTSGAQLLSPAPIKPAATLELVAQAQATWNEGDHSAALQLLRGALQRLESVSAKTVQDTAATAVLAREYARYGLINGQVAEVLATLERLEPHLADVADIWAIRGNAAQRLGRHAQAVAAYQQALALSPNEPRWMLGAAVSMAASGQTGPAADMAEKVRIARALPADVANYLRQLGVVVRPD
jgi:tetratricopeptide (TPR) repeat protein